MPGRPADATTATRWPSLALGLVLGFLSLALFGRTDAPPVPGTWQATATNLVHASKHYGDRLSDFRKSPSCNITSTALHEAYAPRCATRGTLLAAMSGGGRRGWDAPYHARGCDMQFFSGDEACRVLSRFRNVYVLGDGGMRHLAQALQALARRDLVDGARVTWTDRIDDADCHCRALFEDPRCALFGAVNTAAVLAGDPGSLRCGAAARGRGVVSYTPADAYPIPARQLHSALAQVKAPVDTAGQDVLILGHGMLNDFETGETLAWLEQLEDHLAAKIPGLYAGDESDSPDDDAAAALLGAVPRLFVTPSAQGVAKRDEFLTKQNNIRLMRFTRSIEPLARMRGYDVLQMYNYSAQVSKPDGVHMGYEHNIMKAMMVLNWLNALDMPS